MVASGDAVRPPGGCTKYGASCTQMMYYGSLLVMMAGMLITPWYQPWVIVQMTLLVVPIIYMGSHRSLRLLKGPSPDGGVIVDDRMTHQQAILVPVIGSVVLLSLYIAFKFFDRDMLNTLLSSYFAIISAFSLADIAYDSIGERLDAISYIKGSYKIVFSRPDTNTELGEMKWTNGYSILLAVFALLGILYVKSKHWLLNNLYAAGLCIEAIGQLSTGNFTIATLLLAGLFIYDIFWVFATDVMVTVAKSFDGPIKMVFPAKFDPFVSSMLGLGDIVMPGVFIALCLRFDYCLHCKKNAVAPVTASGQAKKLTAGSNADKSTVEGSAATDGNVAAAAETVTDIHEPFNKFYFSVVTIGYTLGLITTVAAMVLYQHPQPALLYLVPYCLASLFGTGALNGHVKDILRYNEQTDDAEKADPTEKKEN